MIQRRTLLSAALGGLSLTGSLQASTAADLFPTATTAQGRLRGRDETGILSFRGIPYAQAERFKAPSPPAPWSGVRDALRFGPMSPQSRGPVGSLFASWTFDTEMSEQCQLLNIWTPALRDGGKRPVMVWLHGGDFSSLSGSRNVFDGTRLCRKGNVVVVTLNHRLNLFGHLHLADLAPQFPDAANAGLLDIIEALRWIRENIAEFGGNPENITLFGQSGGGAKVSCLMAMPSAQGLFHKAIVQSGSYYLEAMSAQRGTELAQALLSALDLDPQKAATLASLPMERLVQGLALAARGPAKANFRPVIDGRHLPAGPWSPQAPAWSAAMPMIIGTTATETTLLTGGRKPESFHLDDAGLRQALRSWFRPEHIDALIAGYRAMRPRASASELFFAIDTHKAFREGAWLQAERKAAQRAGKVWLYELDWLTPVDGGKWSSPHSLDLAMVFDNVAMSASMVGTSPEAQLVADQMSSAWLAFAHHSDPNRSGAPAWPAFDALRRATMVFDRTSRAIDDHRGDERKLLEKLSHR